jgi:natural resistance-associated macrophage protein
MMKESSSLKTKDSLGCSGKFEWHTLRRFMGPGFIMSLAYLDPGNLEADLQQGAYTNCRLLWVLWWSTAAGLLLQEMSSRLCVVTGVGLAETCKARYHRSHSIVLYMMMELAIIGSDIQEVVGSAIAFNILFGWPLWVGCLVTALNTFVLLAIYQCRNGFFEVVIGGLISVIAVCFIGNFLTT